MHWAPPVAVCPNRGAHGGKPRRRGSITECLGVIGEEMPMGFRDEEIPEVSWALEAPLPSQRLGVLVARHAKRREGRWCGRRL